MISPRESTGGKLGKHHVDLDESQRQAVLLALAQLSISRPGWLIMLREIAEQFCGASMFDKFRTTSGLPPGCPKASGNDFEVVRQGDKIRVLHLRRVFDDNSLTLQGAVLLAAWLAVLADPELAEFHRLAKEITK
jgi:hypothetical protein